LLLSSFEKLVSNHIKKNNHIKWGTFFPQSAGNTKGVPCEVVKVITINFQLTKLVQDFTEVAWFSVSFKWQIGGKRYPI
jgi:hypothetical protein